MECSLPGSPVNGISQSRILEWVAISFSKGSSLPGIKLASPVSPALQMDSLLTEPSGKPSCQLVVSETERGQDTGFECADQADGGAPGQDDAWLTRCTVT